MLRLAFVYDKLDQPEAAPVAFEEAIQVAKSVGDSRSAIFALDDIGGIAYRNRRCDEAERYWREGLEISKRERTRVYEAKFSFFLGIARRNRGHLDDARLLMEESGDLYRSLGMTDLAERSDRQLHELDLT